MATQIKALNLADALALSKEREDELRDELKLLTIEQDEIKGLLLKELETKRIKAVESGDYVFTHAIRSGYEITDEDAALSWAKKENCIAINKIRMAKMLKGKGALPTGIEFKETAYLSVSARKEIV